MKGVQLQGLLTEWEEAGGRLALVVASFDRPECGLVARDLMGKTVQVQLAKWYRPRTTGEESQSAHLHGHFRDLAKFTGHTLGEIKEYAKSDCADWPHREVQIGKHVRMVPQSEADANTVEESALIEWCHVKAAEIGCTLRESDRPRVA